jgi:uncharacterized coiled-coil protein SlyX
MKREDVLNVDALKEELSSGVQQLNTTLRSVFGQLVYALDTVIERHNALEIRLAESERRVAVLSEQLTAVQGQLALVSERLLALERSRGEH